MKRVIVVGSGFGGAASVRALRKLLGRTAEIVVVSPRPELIYYPGLIWIPTGARKPEDLRVNLTGFFRKNGATHHPGNIVGLEDGGRTVVTDNGPVTGDAVLIATGAQSLRKLPGIEHSLSICSGIDEAVKIRERLSGMTRGRIAVGFAGNPEEPSAVRGGPSSRSSSAWRPGSARRGSATRWNLSSSAPRRNPETAWAPRLSGGFWPR